MGRLKLSSNDKARMAEIAKGAQYPSEREEAEEQNQSDDVVLKRTPLKRTVNSGSASSTDQDESSKHAKEEVMSFSTVIPPTGREVETQRFRVQPHETTLWEGNPRNFSNAPIDNLLPLIQATNGNTIPVFARYDKDGVIEIIAGSRRRKACLELNKLLTVDVINCTDAEADAIAYMENEGRLDVDAFSNGQFLLSRFDLRKMGDPNLTVSQFANSFGVERETMSRYLSIGALPAELKDQVRDHSTFGRNACLKLKSAFNKASEELTKDVALLKITRASKFKDCASLIHFIKKLTATEEPTPVAPQKWSLGEGTVNFKQKKNGTKVIELDKHIALEVIEEIERILEKPKS